YAEIGRSGFTARGGANGGHIVAGDRLFRRRDQGLHFLIVVRRDSLDRLRVEGDLPAARRRAGQLDILRRRRADISDKDRDRSFLPGGGTRRDQPFPAAYFELGLSGDGHGEVGGGRRILSSDTRNDFVVAGRSTVWRRYFELHVLALPGVDRH